MRRRDSKALYAPVGPNTLPSASTEALWQEQDTAVTRKRPFMTWIITAWTLVIHCILSAGVTILVLVYVNHHHFNITERYPPVQVIGGTRATPFRLMQSDVVTILSGIIAILKGALTAWAASLCWRVAFFLMERRGLARRDLEKLINYGQLAPGVYSRDWTTPIIATLLLAILCANLSSPLLSGSISWVPSNQLVSGLPSLDPIYFAGVDSATFTNFPDFYRDQDFQREGISVEGTGLASIGWGRDIENGVLRRVSRSLGALGINSTIENVTIPYFEVHSIQWIENADEIPDIRDNGPYAALAKNRDLAPVLIDFVPFGAPILIPNTTITNWSSDPLESRVVEETVLLMFLHGRTLLNESEPLILVQDLPRGIYTTVYDRFIYSFAWITYSAGVGRCKDYKCRITSSSTVQNTTAIELEPHQLTYQSLLMSPVIGLSLVNQNASIPFPWSTPVNDYIEAVLVRSYSGAWDTLNANLGTVDVQSSYVPTLPALFAEVDETRVYIWLGLQLFVTLFSVLFIVLQFRLSKYPLTGDTTFAAFYLDTTGIPRHDEFDNNQLDRKALFKIEPQGDRLKLTLE